MRSLLLFVTVLAACELKPPPPKAAPGSGSAPPVAVQPAAQPPTPVIDAGAGSATGRPIPPPPPPVGEACGALAIHIADVLVQAGDPTQRGALEQNRPILVRQAGGSCEVHHWNADKIKCYAATRTQADFAACDKLP